MDTGVLLSAMLIGTFGLGFFVYGKKSQNLTMLALGIGFMLYPYFVHSVLWMWLIAALSLIGVVALRRFSSTGAA